VWAFLRRAGTIILAASVVLWLMLTFPRAEPPPGASPAEARRHGLEHSLAGRAGHAIEPVVAPLGFDWKIGVGLLASLAAREVIVSTLAQIYAASEEETSLRRAVREDVDPRTGQRVFTAATVASLLVFFVFALQCLSTIAIMRRETNSWRWRGQLRHPSARRCDRVVRRPASACGIRSGSGPRPAGRLRA
jgi:ferrous iron transport protein B